MLENEFAPVELADYTKYLNIWEACPMKTADYTFINLWAWAEAYGLEWRIDANELIWIRQCAAPGIGQLDTPFLWAPLGDWNKIDWKTLSTSELSMQEGSTWFRTPESLCLLLQEQCGEAVRLVESKAQWEYVYLQEELSTLPGNKFHKKRNHMNQFSKRYGIDYRPFTVDILPEVLDMQRTWCENRSCRTSPSLLAEGEALVNILINWEELPFLVGGALYDKDKMVAFSIGEAMRDDMLVVHFEKAFMDYRGSYQAINMLFSANAGKGFTYINREQDAGEPALHKAKQSYFPNHFLRKNMIVFQ